VGGMTDGRPENRVPLHAPGMARRTLRACVARTEVFLLAAALLVTVLAKLRIVRSCAPPSVVEAWLGVALPDLAFFSGLATLGALAYAVWPRKWTARLTLVLATLVLVWAVLNGIWLAVTGVQLQPGVLQVVLRHPTDFWPTVRPHLGYHPRVALGLVVAVPAALAWVIWRIVRPAPAKLARGWWVGGAAVCAALVILLLAVHRRATRSFVPESLDQVLGYSSHWGVIESAFATSDLTPAPGTPARHVPIAGERSVGLPPAASAVRPNIVLLMLESVPYTAAVAGTPEYEAMPTLNRLAGEGMLFESLRVPVPQTGKAMWATLTGTTPDVGPDYVESVLADAPYEGLPTLLARVGYRSAFFEMSKGTFQCAPATFANFGFDWAWFRENLEDASADLGYLSGDDFRMLDPALAWATSASGPFLLMLITSAAHDPYEVPAWFEPPANGSRNRYLQALRYTDAFIAELLQRLAAHQLADQTLLCMLGDHGEGFRAESHRLRWIPYEEVLRVPWVLHWPGHVPPGTRAAWPCSQLDVTPTLLTLLGFDISGAGFEGRCALTPCDPDRRLYFTAWYEGSPAGYVEGNTKRVYWPTSGRVQEYDLATDPQEKSPIVLESPAAEQVVADLRNWRRAQHLDIPAKRFRQRFVYDHWWVFSTGRYARAYYVP